jgi:hypothetical protein
MRRLALTGTIALVAVAAACGNPTTTPYTHPTATKDCLTKLGYRVKTRFNDVIASTAGHGALRARKNYQVVTILFADDAEQAKGLRRGYAHFMPKRRARHILELTDIEKNTLLLWTTTPARDELGNVVNCLS